MEPNKAPGPALKRVSVITPCLNPGDRFTGCLDSLAAQSYAAVEHIVVDGGSTDGTVELAQSRGARVISEPDRGQTDALNKGFALASGEYIGWLNADDRLLPEALERVVGTFAARPKVGWVYCDCEIRRGSAVEVFRPPARLAKKTFDFGNRLTQPGTFIARWALDRVGPLNEEMQLAMDFDLWVRLLDAGVPAAYLPEALAVFEIHPSSKTGRTDLSEFYREEALALLKSGRRRPAAASLGRAAAAAALTEDGRVDSGRLATTIGRFEHIATTWDLEAERRVVRPTAFVESARFELVQGSPRGLRHLARPTPWMSGTSLRMIGRDVLRGAPITARRVLRRSPGR
jgi:GT2 family glycosyltransferase